MEFTPIDITDKAKFNFDTMVKDGDADEQHCERHECDIAQCEANCSTDTGAERYYGIFLCNPHWRQWREQESSHQWLVEHGLAVIGNQRMVKQWLST